MSEQRRKLPWKPVLIVFVSGIVLAGSSCAGAINAAMSNHTLLEKLFSDGFFFGVLVTLLSVFVLVIMAAISMFTGKSRGPS